jgi:hypothetical protein
VLEVAAPALAIAAVLAFSPRSAALVATALVLLLSVRALTGRIRSGPDLADDLEPLRQQLARCRRRAETASIAVIEPADSAAPRRIARSLRCTDAAALIWTPRGARVIAALDGHRLDRTGLEQRLTTLCDGRMRAGWASFPDDGMTLETLIERATADMEQFDSPAHARFGQTQARAETELVSA